MAMTITWVLIAHGSAAKILEIGKSQDESKEVKNFYHPRTAKKQVREGLSRIDNVDSVAQGVKSMPIVPAIDYSGEMEDHEREVFAKEIAEYLTKACGLTNFNKLVVVASRNMLGHLRKEFPKTVKRHIEHELDKNFLAQKLTDTELLEAIRNDLGLVSW
jgi:protein required for attachment to host cells